MCICILPISLNRDANRFQNYQRAVVRHNNYVNNQLQNLKVENSQRAAQGLPPKSEQEVLAAIKVIALVGCGDRVCLVCEEERQSAGLLVPFLARWFFLISCHCV